MKQLTRKEMSQIKANGKYNSTFTVSAKFTASVRKVTKDFKRLKIAIQAAEILRNRSKRGYTVSDNHKSTNQYRWNTLFNNVFIRAWR